MYQFQEILVFILVLVAAYFLGRHLKRMLTIGDEKKSCAGCPLNKPGNFPPR